MKNKPIAVDLFCGVGGMALGFENAGFDVVAAFDSHPLNVEIYSKNFPNCSVHQCDLSQVSGDDLRSLAKLGKKQIDVVFGGPPCQGFSTIGKRRVDDPRSKLLYEFARLILELKPQYFVVENVKGLTQGHAREFLDAFVECVKEKYNVVEPVIKINAIQVGVPQQRERIFVVGSLKRINKLEAVDSLLSPTPIPAPTVWDAIGDLPDIDKIDYLNSADTYLGKLGRARSKYARTLRENRNPRKEGLTGCMRTLHTPAVIERFEKTIPGTEEPISHFYRLSKRGYCNTLRAGSGPEHGSFMAARPIHPVQPRCITVREAARLHSFPDDFVFHPTKWHGFRQIGNSVPPLLAQAVADTLMISVNRA